MTKTGLVEYRPLLGEVVILKCDGHLVGRGDQYHDPLPRYTCVELVRRTTTSAEWTEFRLRRVDSSGLANDVQVTAGEIVGPG